MTTHDPYDAIGRYYALEQGEQNDDLPFFLELAGHTGGPVLDLGAGAGRVTAALADAGYDVTALEASETMLGLARTALEPHLGKHASLVAGDMLNFKLDGRYPLAVCAAGTFAHVTDEVDQLRMLRGVRRHLAPEGILALVLQNPYQLVVDPPRSEVVVQWRGIDPQTEDGITKLVTNDAELGPQLLHVGAMYDVVRRDGTLRRFETEFTLRWSYQRELELLLQKAGFGAAEWYGDYDRSPYSGESPLLIVVTQNS